MQNATLCYLIRTNPQKQILLGFKKKGFGKGKLNGFGGKVEANESIEAAAVRELYEETGVKVKIENLQKVCEFTGIFPFSPKPAIWNQTVHVFFIKKWQGDSYETNEMKPVWLDAAAIPFDKTWQSDKHWLPLILQGKKIKARLIFGKDNETPTEIEVKEISGF